MTDLPDKYRVPGGLYRATRLVKASEGLWQRLGQLESWALRDDIDPIPISQPLYVTSLARSGTTIVTEMLNEHPDVTSHRYADFPFTYTPYWRNWLRDRTRVASAEPVERAHRDRILVTEDSPEAVEEILWSRFFPGLHDSGRDSELTTAHRNPEFDNYYQDHIRKLLLVRGTTRYLAKGNYNVSRIRYLLNLFPDARFVIPVRRPLDHIASLHKQHRFFSEGQRLNPRMRSQLGAAGHFEFGLDRTAISLGDKSQVARIESCWQDGRDAEGWGHYWSLIFGYLKDLTEQDPMVAEACLFVRYEDLCRQSGETIDRISAHCRLDPATFAPIRAQFVEKLSPPDYYQPDFSREELAQIEATTADTAQRFGY
jgi:hypothetical protein